MSLDPRTLTQEQHLSLVAVAAHRLGPTLDHLAVDVVHDAVCDHLGSTSRTRSETLTDGVLRRVDRARAELVRRHTLLAMLRETMASEAQCETLVSGETSLDP